MLARLSSSYFSSLASVTRRAAASPLLGVVALRRIDTSALLRPAAAVPSSSSLTQQQPEISGGARSAAAGALAAQQAAGSLLPALMAGMTLLADVMPSIVMIGKKKHRGKNKRRPTSANHGARPCSHVMRRRRAAVLGRIKPKIR